MAPNRTNTNLLHNREETDTLTNYLALAAEGSLRTGPRVIPSPTTWQFTPPLLY